MLQADERERPAVAATRRALADLYRKVGRTEQALAAEYQAEQLARHYREAATRRRSGMTTDLTQASAAQLGSSSTVKGKASRSKP